MIAAILHQHVEGSSSVDDLDVLRQKEAIAEALRHGGRTVVEYGVTLDLGALKSFLAARKPSLCFNLVESIDGTGRFLHFVPALLEQMGIPFTGSGSEALYLTTDKILAKERFLQAGIPTPPWSDGESPAFEPPYILKPVSEDASVDIDGKTVAATRSELADLWIRKTEGRRFFVERFVAGREINLSLLASPDGAKVLPPAEILFEDYPPDKPRVVGYSAKWDEDSFEFAHTPRRFDFPDADKDLLSSLEEMAARCWSAFHLRGYARVDFRIDGEGRPWVLEINANPCISPDSGFVAAAGRAGLSFESVVERIVADSSS